MADGNVGNLWMSLGLKDAVSKELKKMADNMEVVDAKTKRAQEQLRKLAETDASGKGVAFLDKLKKAIGSSTKEAKELQAIFDAIRNIRGGFGALTGDFGKANLQSYADILKEIRSSMGEISFGGMSGIGEGIYAKIEAVRSAINGINKITNETFRLWDSVPRSSPKAKAEFNNIREQLAEIKNAGLGYLKSGDFSKAYAWANGLDEQIGKISSSYEKFLASEKSVVESLRREEGQSRKTTDATNEQTNAIKKQEEQLKATTAAQKEKSAAESKAAAAPKMQPFVEDKGLDKMLNDVTAAREKDAAATQTQIAYTKILNEVLDAFKGKASTLLGVKDDSGRKYVDILNEANAAIEKMNKARAEAMAREGKDFNSAKYFDPTPRIKKALEYLSLLQRIDIAQKHISEVKAANPNVDTKNIEEAAKLVENFRNKLLALQNDKYLTGADDAHILGAYRKTLAMTLKDVDAIIGKLQKPNPLSDLDGNFSKLDARIDAVREKLAKLRDLMNEGTQKGYNTSMFGERISGLGGIVTRMEAAMSNKNGELANVDKMKQLFSDISVEVNKASTVMQAYGREKAKAVATDRNLETMEARYRRLQELISEVSRKIRELNDSAKQGFKVGADTSRVESAISRLFEMRDKFNNADIGSKNAVAELVSEYKILKNEIGNAKSEQDKLNNAITRANKKQDRKNERQEARDNKQRLSEIKATEARYDSLGNKVRALRREFSRGISLGADVSKAEAEIHRLIHLMRYLKIMHGALKAGSMSDVGRIGSVGTGHDATIANRTLQGQRAINAAQEKTNREKEKSVDLERKHQQEIANSAAKVRNDLARAFEQAKKSAGGLSSTMQDIKSLIMQGGLVYGMQQFVMSIIKTGGELEKQHIALQSILGDIQNANTMFSQVKQLALQSPFTFSELNKDVKQLAAYGVEYDQLYDTTKRLADMASGLGVSFERIALAFGQVRSRGWLDGKELRQISYAGIPLLQKLSEYYSKREGQKVSTSDVKTRISGRGVDFEDVKNVFWEMTDAGGQFYNMQLVLSETLLGRFNKLKDAWEIMLSEFASGSGVVGSSLKGILDITTNLVLSLNSFAPVIAAAFSGPLLTKAISRLSGGLDKALLTAKGGIANDLIRKSLEGKKLNKVERGILSNKNRITAADIKNLSAANALTKAELRRLFVTGKITKEMYKQGMALQAQNTASQVGFFRKQLDMVKGLFVASRWSALGGMMASGLMRGASSLVGFFGGLPGIALTAFTTILAYSQQKSAELKQKMQQTMEELEDRAKQMSEFLRDNNAEKIASKGNEKEISNAIDAYEDKIRELSPQSATMFIMSAKEKQSHKERLLYLADCLKTLEKANQIAKDIEGDEDKFKGFDKDTGKVAEFAKKLEKASAGMHKVNKTIFDVSDFNSAQSDFDQQIQKLAQRFKKEFSSISTSTTQQEAYKAMRENMVGKLGLSEEASKMIRSALDRALGLRDTELEKAFSDKVMTTVNNAFPGIADAIRANKTLDEESRKKVENIMRGAAAELSISYPYWETELQRLLANSDFKAKIKLVTDNLDGDDQLDPFQYRLLNNLTGTTTGKEWQKRLGQWEALKPFTKGQNSIYDVRNAVNSELTTRWNKLKAEKNAAKSGKGNAVEQERLQKSYDDLWNAAYNALGYKYVPEDKKSNKNKSAGKDTGLERLRQQLDDFKAARQYYQKLRKEAGFSKQKAKNETVSLYKDLDWKKIDLNNYLGSLENLKAGFNFDKSDDRKKFRTQIDKEKAEWKLSEDLKPEWERVAANFKEALEKGVKQANLQKELYEKTGSQDFAKLALQDGTVWNEQTRKMAEDFKKNFGHDVNLGMTEADAKVQYEDAPLALESWQKITTLVKDNYVKYLQQAADIIAQTASTQEKIATIYAKYETPIAQAKEAGDNGLAYRYTRQRDKEVNSVKTEAFNKSSDYITFFGAVSQLGMDRASEIASQIRENINQALADGTIDAREYGKQIQQLDEQLNKLSSGKKTFFKDGLSGLADSKVEKANEKITAGATLQQEGQREAQEATTAMLDAMANSDWKAVGEAFEKIVKANEKTNEGKNKLKEGKEEASSANKFKKAMAAASKVVDKFNANIQSIVATFNDIKDTASALGVDTESDGWQDATAFFESLGGISDSISTIVTSGMQGNVGGVIQGVVGIFTSPFKAFAAAHDAKQERQIKLAERNITELERLRNDVKTAIENTLGGVYSYKMDKDTKATLKKVTDSYEKGVIRNNAGIVTGNKSQYSSETYNTAKKSLANPDNAFLAEQASLMAQKDEMQRKLNAEQGKKKKDKDKIADYKQEIKEMETTIKQLATDFLKDIYGVDMKSWASQLTDAVVSAWEKGEDAIDAYKKKARDMVKDLTKNILSQKIMEKALEGPLEALTTTIKQKGRLEPEDVLNVTNELYKQTDDAVHNITAILESLKNRGLDLSATGDSSLTNGIKNITEETADILASYVNAIRLDVSVNRAQVKDIGELLKMRLPEMGQIQKAQLGQLTQIVMLAEARNEKLDRMMDWMNAVSTSGRKKLYIS
jgi:hypothetical protein